MLPEFITLTISQEMTRRYSHQALPDAPEVADFLPPKAPRFSRSRAWISRSLHGIADQIAPAQPARSMTESVQLSGSMDPYRPGC